MKKRSPEEYEAAKQKALKSGSAQDVMKFQGDLTNQQLNDAVNRIRNENALRDISQQNMKTGWDKAKELANNMGTVTDLANKGVGLYNVGAKVWNSLSDRQIPEIGNANWLKDRIDAATEAMVRNATQEQIREWQDHPNRLSTSQLQALNKRLAQENNLNTSANTRYGARQTQNDQTGNGSSLGGPAVQLNTYSIEKASSNSTGYSNRDEGNSYDRTANTVRGSVERYSNRTTSEVTDSASVSRGRSVVEQISDARETRNNNTFNDFIKRIRN